MANNILRTLKPGWTRNEFKIEDLEKLYIEDFEKVNFKKRSDK